MMFDKYNKNDIMTLSDVAEYLKLADRTVLKMIHNNEIPCLKIANQWRFIKPILDEWLTSKLNFIPAKKSFFFDNQNIRISEFINNDFFVPDIKAYSREEVFEQLAEPLVKNKLIDNKNILTKRLIERENILPTSIGSGFAVPHVRNIDQNPIKENYIVLGICKNGIDFGAWDKKLTYIFILFGAVSNILHLKFMSQIAQIFYDNNMVDKIINKPDISSVLAHILKKEYEIIIGNK